MKYCNFHSKQFVGLQSTVLVIFAAYDTFSLLKTFIVRALWWYSGREQHALLIVRAQARTIIDFSLCSKNT